MGITIVEQWKQGTKEDYSKLPSDLPDWHRSRILDGSNYWGFVVIKSTGRWKVEKSFPQNIDIYPEISDIMNTNVTIFVVGIKPKYPGYESYGSPRIEIRTGLYELGTLDIKSVDISVTFRASDFILGPWEETPANYFRHPNFSGGNFSLTATTVGIHYRPSISVSPDSISFSIKAKAGNNNPDLYDVIVSVVNVPVSGGTFTVKQGDITKTLKVTNFNNRSCWMEVGPFIQTKSGYKGDVLYGEGYIEISSYVGWGTAITCAGFEPFTFMVASPTYQDKVINKDGTDLALIKTKVFLTNIKANQENYIRFINRNVSGAEFDTEKCQRVVLCSITNTTILVSSTSLPSKTPPPLSAIIATPLPSKTPPPFTPLPSKTPPPTLSKSPPLTPSVTGTLSPSASLSPTPSITPSVTPSITPSVSLSNTPSVTPSVTPSNTPSNSLTPTPSQTLELSPTPTPSNTAGVTTTPTPTQTPSNSASATPTNNSFVTLTPTPSSTISNTATPSITPSKTERPKATRKPSLILPTPTSIPQKKQLNYNPQIISSLFLKTTKDYISPFIDTKRLSYTLIHNNINKLVTNQDQDLELNSKGGIAKARYITKPVKLNSDAPASKLFISYSANIPKNCLIRLYYRVYNTIEDPETFILSKNWNFVAHSGTRNTYSDDQFLDFEYQIDEIIYTDNSSLKEFDMFSIKIILESENDSIVPKVKDFRVIALS